MEVLDLDRRLQDIGLDLYTSAFQAEGFETWQQLLDVTEADLETLGVKLGHRRRLQRAIQSDRSQSGQQPLEGQSKDVFEDSREGPETIAPSNTQGSTIENADAVVRPPTKRRYRRHPKPDSHAPEKPPSAYVIFSNRLRETYKGLDVSFTNMAKIAGERWQDPDPKERSYCERQAQELKETYYAKLAMYKETQAYAEYQAYLADFKERHGDPKAQDTKRHRPSFSRPEPASRSSGEATNIVIEDLSPRSSHGRSPRSPGYTESEGPQRSHPQSSGARATEERFARPHRRSITSVSDSSRSGLSGSASSTTLAAAGARSARPWEISASREAPSAITSRPTEIVLPAPSFPAINADTLGQVPYGTKHIPDSPMDIRNAMIPPIGRNLNSPGLPPPSLPLLQQPQPSSPFTLPSVEHLHGYASYASRRNQGNEER